MSLGAIWRWGPYGCALSKFDYALITSLSEENTREVATRKAWLSGILVYHILLFNQQNVPDL